MYKFKEDFSHSVDGIVVVHYQKGQSCPPDLFETMKSYDVVEKGTGSPLTYEQQPTTSDQ